MLAYTLENTSTRSKNNIDEKVGTANNYIGLFTSWKHFKNVFKEPSLLPFAISSTPEFFPFLLSPLGP